jgi:predicted aldo/keto reductase-like oxidoreductase
MKDFGLYRYNMLESKGHWFPGGYATDEAIAKVDLGRVPAGIDLPAMLRETHRELYREKKK